ncbi:fas-binding factor 1 [Trichonephila inaurata madagascariensis]|uniref:Fas-binding factor 1 n=1 Tax=Trichonephila inaurata madagascariensis TaxID=2747483 RepID=A0A8X6I8F7_9ARAC|nr:fas-binding factor 1 [Trichonephila inaurata madagascariensis]
MLYSFHNSEDNYDFGAMLKKLDELDAKHYTPQEKLSDVKEVNKMSVPTGQGGDSNFSDFDNSDEDLASLLADDDDDIFASKTFGDSTSKKTSNQKTDPIFSPKKPESATKPDSKILQGVSREISPKKTFIKDSSKKNDDDALNDFLNKSNLPSFLTDSKKTSTVKSTKKVTEESEDESDFLDGVTSKSAPLKSQRDKTLKSKSSISDDEDNDILKSLESDEKISGTPRKQRSGSFFDDFLKNLSPKNSPKKSVSDPIDDIKGDDSDEDDLLKSLESDDKDSTSPKKNGSFFDDFLKNISPKHSPKKSAKVDAKVERPSDIKRKGSGEEDISGKFPLSPKKSNSPVKKNSGIEKKRENLQKQVSFKDILETSPEKMLKEKENPLKEQSSFLKNTQLDDTDSNAKIPSKTSSQPRRSEKMGASTKDETDWLNFFKESPKKSSRPKESSVKQKISDEIQSPSKDSKFNPDRRKSSGADWLGLSDTKPVSRGDLQISKESKISVETEDEWLTEKEPFKVPRPYTSPNKRQDDLELSVESKIPKETNDEWITEKDIIRESRPHTTPGRRRQDDSQTGNLHWLSDDKSPVRKNKTISDAPGIYRESAVSYEANAVDMNIKTTVRETQNFQDVFLPQENRKASSGLHFEKKEVDLQYYPPELQSVPKSPKNNYAHRNISKDSGVGSEFMSDTSHSSHALQTIINNHIFEKDQLLKSSETMKLMYEERIKSLETLHKDQLKASEESFKIIENKLRLELEEKIKSSEDKLNSVQQEKSLQEQNLKIKLEQTEKENLKEIQRLKDLHSQSIALMKQDHEEALLRLKRLKEQEIEALLSTQAHSRSLQHLTEQLEARTAEMASLQMKLEERNQETMREKQTLLEAKERDLKNLQNRLQRQLDNSDDERERLQQLVLKLESRLQKYATEGEEDRWEVQQLKARLSVQQKHLDEEYKFQVQQLEKEKEKLRLSQKTVLVQLAQERQQLMQEKVDIELLAKRIKEDEAKLHVKTLKEESFMERQKQYIQQEQSKILFEKSNVKQELELLEREKEVFDSERQILKEEKLKINELNFKLRKKENELEILAMSTTEEKERGQMEHQAALKIKADQHFRDQQISKKMQELMEKEHQILSEKEKLTEEKLELERKKNSVLCNKCKLSLGHPINAPPVSIGQPTANISNAAAIGASSFLNGISNTLVPPHLDPSLVVWYITAQKDREFLQEELSFLKSLKESSKNYKK